MSQPVQPDHYSPTPYFIEAAEKRNGLLKTHHIKGTHKTDILIVGGGMAGAATATTLVDQLPPSTTITLVEQAPALAVTTTGKSGGFIADHIDEDYYNTDSSVSFQLRQGIEGIVQAVLRHGLSCNLREVPSIYAVRQQQHLKEIEREYEARKRDGFTVQRVSAEDGHRHIGFDHVYGAMVQSGTRHIDPLAFVTGLVRSLQKHERLQVYTDTPVRLDTRRKIAQTPQGKVHYDTVIVTAGGGGPDIHFLRRKVFFYRDLIAVTQPLTEEQSEAIWPSRTKYLFWDYEPFNYIYGAPLADGRLLMGGGTPLSRIVTLQEYRKQQTLDAQTMQQTMHALLVQAFPSLNKHLPPFSNVWSGIIPMSIDSLPFLGQTAEDHFVALYNQNLSAAFRGGELISTYFATGKPPEGFDLFRHDRKSNLKQRICAWTQRQPFAIVANMILNHYHE